MIYILDPSDHLYTHLLLYLGLMPQVAENISPPGFVFSSSYDFG